MLRLVRSAVTGRWCSTEAYRSATSLNVVVGGRTERRCRAHNCARLICPGLIYTLLQRVQRVHYISSCERTSGHERVPILTGDQCSPRYCIHATADEGPPPDKARPCDVLRIKMRSGQLLAVRAPPQSAGKPSGTSEKFASWR